MTQRIIEELTEADCLALARTEVTGRFVYTDAEGPGAVPVNFAIAGNQVVFRTEAGSHLRDVLTGPVAFEVDHTHPENAQGWSVLFRGHAEEVPLDGVPELLKQTKDAFPHPWGEGVHNVWIAITPTKVTGRRLEKPYEAAIF